MEINKYNVVEVQCRSTMEVQCSRMYNVDTMEINKLERRDRPHTDLTSEQLIPDFT